jgi:hypothetical protein
MIEVHLYQLDFANSRAPEASIEAVLNNVSFDLLKPFKVIKRSKENTIEEETNLFKEWLPNTMARWPNFWLAHREEIFAKIERFELKEALLNTASRIQDPSVFLLYLEGSKHLWQEDSFFRHAVFAKMLDAPSGGFKEEQLIKVVDLLEIDKNYCFSRVESSLVGESMSFSLHKFVKPLSYARLATLPMLLKMGFSLIEETPTKDGKSMVSSWKEWLEPKRENGGGLSVQARSENRDFLYKYANNVLLKSEKMEERVKAWDVLILNQKADTLAADIKNAGKNGLWDVRDEKGRNFAMFLSEYSDLEFVQVQRAIPENILGALDKEGRGYGYYLMKRWSEGNRMPTIAKVPEILKNEKVGLKGNDVFEFMKSFSMEGMLPLASSKVLDIMTAREKIILAEKFSKTDPILFALSFELSVKSSGEQSVYFGRGATKWVEFLGRKEFDGPEWENAKALCGFVVLENGKTFKGEEKFKELIQKVDWTQAEQQFKEAVESKDWDKLLNDRFGWNVRYLLTNDTRVLKKRKAEFNEIESVPWVGFEIQRNRLKRLADQPQMIKRGLKAL